MKVSKVFLSLAAAGLLIPAAFAQEAIPDAAEQTKENIEQPKEKIEQPKNKIEQPKNKIEQRKAVQQKRIGQGVKNGSLTAGEAARLEKKEAAINREERHMKKKSDGKLTPEQQRRITRQQNATSKQIYRDKHNARVQPPAKGVINTRKREQQQRVGNGIKNGSLTASEAARVEKKQAALNRDERRMKSDGNFTPKEQARVNKKQNRLSRMIHRNKHNDQKQ